MVLFGFIVFLAVFAAVGIFAVIKAKNDVGDYLLAGRSVSPVVAGLSAVASNNSGFMFIGAIGFTVQFGYGAIWLLLAWIAGDYFSWFFVHRKLRQRSGDLDARSITSFLASEAGTRSFRLQRIIGILTLIFLTLYAAGQMKAGAKALQGTLAMGPTVGIYIAAVLVVAYSYAGGIRASIWTDVAQSFVMLFAMFALVWAGHLEIPINTVHEHLQTIDMALISLTPGDAQLGVVPYGLGWFVAGFCGIGQPHIIVRAMTLDSADSIKTMRRVYFLWYVLFSVATFLVGLYARLLLGVLDFDAELALPKLALQLLPGFWVGMILAAMFAATISTADSQVLACSASVTQDIYPKLENNFKASKVATVSVIFLAMLLALVGPSSVYVLVTLAWGLLGTAIAPLMLGRVLDWRFTENQYFVSAGIGLMTMLVWKYAFGLGDSVYEGAIGFIVCTILLVSFEASHKAKADESSSD